MKKLFIILSVLLLSCNGKPAKNKIKSVNDFTLTENEIMLDISFSEDYSSVWVQVLDTVKNQEYFKVWLVEKNFKKSLEERK